MTDVGTMYANAKALHELLQEARAENDKLREERDMYRDLVGLMDHPDLNVQLQAENDKLRELVRDMYTDVCRAYVGGRPLAPYQFTDRTRELGVEV